MSNVVGIGIDLTQHIPLVTAAVSAESFCVGSTKAASTLAQHWPPRVEICGSFHRRMPTAVLPLTAGEPLMVGDSAAVHRRSIGLEWPPEAQVPFAGDPACGVGRIPLIAAWTALLPQPGEKEMMTRRDDPEFKWTPDGREHAARAGRMLAASIKAFLKAAPVPVNSCLTAIVVPDALDEAGQQILLDNLAHLGLATDNVHLLPRPLAVALHWCNTLGACDVTQVSNDEEGTVVGRLRISTMAVDVWEAVSLELRARKYEGRIWLVPVRDPARLNVTAEFNERIGLSLALALARVEAKGEQLAWWPLLFADDWLAKRLAANPNLKCCETQAIREVHSSDLPQSLRQDLNQLTTLRSLWSRLFQLAPRTGYAVEQQWSSQEQLLGISALPCKATLADGSFACLRGEDEPIIAEVVLPLTRGNNSQVFPTAEPAAVQGAALAAAAIGHGLPCYREKLLPLDLYVLGRDEYGDPAPRWKELVEARTVEAGRLWRSSAPVLGLEIRAGQQKLLLPVRRTLEHKPMFRRVGAELVTPVPHDEPVHIEVSVKPGQGFAQVRVKSVTPGLFATRLDWRTMEECTEPQPPPLAYLPGVSRIDHDREMFTRAESALRAALEGLERGSGTANYRLRQLISEHLNKWPLAHHVERARGRRVGKDFMLHYGVIGSSGQLHDLPAPGLALALRTEIGKRFSMSVARGRMKSDAAEVLLRAGGWFYLALPDECYDYLRSRLYTGFSLSAVELHAMGLAFEAPEDLRLFYPLLVQALSTGQRPNNWLRALRNICRFRNHALHPDVITNALLFRLVQTLLETMQEQANKANFQKIFSNCLETLPFLLKRRRYERDFLAPVSVQASALLEFLETVDRNWRNRLPNRLQLVPRATLNFLRMEATVADIERLLEVAEEGEDVE